MVHGSPEVALVKRLRAQVIGDAANCGDRQIDVHHGRLDTLDDIRRRLLLFELLDSAGEAELDAGEQLSELVVQLAGDARPLELPHLLEALGQSAQLLRRTGVYGGV